MVDPRALRLLLAVALRTIEPDPTKDVRVSLKDFQDEKGDDKTDTRGLFFHASETDVYAELIQREEGERRMAESRSHDLPDGMIRSVENDPDTGSQVVALGVPITVMTADDLEGLPPEIREVIEHMLADAGEEEAEDQPPLVN